MEVATELFLNSIQIAATQNRNIIIDQVRLNFNNVLSATFF
jgi:hypothetical protein